MLDTNICIYLMKRQPPEVARRFEACRQGDIVVSAITYAELAYGVASSGERAAQNRAALAALVDLIPVAPFDAAAGDEYGIVRAAAKERARDALDKLIAGHARALGCVLVTNDERDFKSYAGLKIENWVENVPAAP